MGHPEIENGTPFAFEPVFVTDEDGRPLFVPVLKASYDVTARGLQLAPEQAPVCLAGEPWGDDPKTSSWRLEPEATRAKPASDVVLLGSAVATKPSTTEVLVAFQVGPARAALRVLGERAFFKSVGSVGMTKPMPFERIPLRWERAFGGWDRSNPDEKKHEREARNPIGVGFRSSHGRYEDGLRAPNLEDPARPFKGWGDRPAPAGVGFTSADWEPRVKHAGTYDKKWKEERAPLLPKDFNKRFLNSAAPGLVLPGHLRGDESVVAAGVSPTGGVSFKLPGVGPASVQAEHTGRADANIPLALDTVVLDTDAGKLFLLWRGELVVREPTALRSIRVMSGPGTPASPAARVA
jgi:hypothetical protein